MANLRVRLLYSKGSFLLSLFWCVKIDMHLRFIFFILDQYIDKKTLTIIEVNLYLLLSFCNPAKIDEIISKERSVCCKRPRGYVFGCYIKGNILCLKRIVLETDKYILIFQFLIHSPYFWLFEVVLKKNCSLEEKKGQILVPDNDKLVLL